MKKLLPLLLLLILVACRNQRATVDAQPILTVSIEPQRWLLEQLVGGRMEVRSLLARGGNPESFDPTFSNLAELEKSRAYFTIGQLPFEVAIQKRVAASNPNLPIICCSDSIAMLRHTHGSHDHGVDPHVWSSPSNMRTMAENMLRGLRKIDPQHDKFYTANFVKLSHRIDSINQACDSILAPHAGESFAVWHPSLSYFARDYHLKQLALGAEGKEHSVNSTRALSDALKASGTKLFLMQKDFDPAQAATLGNGVRTIVIDPLNYHWDNEMLHTARAIAGEN